MSRTERKAPHWLSELERRGLLAVPYYKWQEKKTRRKSPHARAMGKHLNRADRRQAKILAKSGVEKTGNLHVRSMVESYD